MNLSLKERVVWSFIIANVLVLGLVFTVFHFLNSLSRDMQAVSENFGRKSLLTDEIRIQAVSLLKYQRKILTEKPSPQVIDQIVGLCESFTSQLQSLDSLHTDPEAKKVVGQMLSYVDSLKLLLSKGVLFDQRTVGSNAVGDLADKILEAFSEFQDIQHYESIDRDKQIEGLVGETKRIMMIVLTMGFLSTIILALVIPGKIALPFKKIKDAIRELQDCNFDVNIYYSQDDEIGEIAREMNKMIHSFKVFDELRADRISVENRKFDALANMLKRPILVSTAQGMITYVNNRTYALLQVQSEDIIGKEMSTLHLSSCIVETFELAIKRRSKIENAAISIDAKQQEDENAKLNESEAKEDESDSEKIREVKKLFEGYANVIPVRGKESSLDYYLMILSAEVFT